MEHVSSSHGVAKGLLNLDLTYHVTFLPPPSPWHRVQVRRPPDRPQDFPECGTELCPTTDTPTPDGPADYPTVQMT